VDADEAEVLDESDEDELERDGALRGTNVPLTSSGFIELLPSVEPHAGSDIGANVRELATAVMRRTDHWIDVGKVRRWSGAIGDTAVAKGSGRGDAKARPRRAVEKLKNRVVLVNVGRGIGMLGWIWRRGSRS